MKSYKKMILIFTGLTLSILLFIASINLWIDPYDVWSNTGSYQRFNLSAKYARLHKSYSQIDQQADIVLLGNSRVFYGVNPNKLESSAKVVNLGLPAATHYENYTLLDNYLKYAEELPQAVYIGLDIAPGFSQNSMQQTSFNIERFHYPHITKIKETLLSYNALLASKQVVVKKSSKNITTVISSLGYAEYKSGVIDYESLYTEKLDAYVNRNWPPLVFLKEGNRPAHYKEHLNWIGKTANLLKENKIPAIFFINPLHADMWQSLRLCQSKDLLGLWKDDLYNIIKPDETVHFVDFGLPNKYTTEPLSTSKGRLYFYEPSHYTPMMGNILINALADIIYSNKSTIRPSSLYKEISDHKAIYYSDTLWNTYDLNNGNRVSRFCK